jgi:hypothetical protein
MTIAGYARRDHSYSWGAPRVGWSMMRVPLSEKPECSQLRILRAKSGFSGPFWRNRVMTERRHISMEAFFADQARY